MKVFRFFMLLLIALTLSCNFTACGGDDDSKTEQSVPDDGKDNPDVVPQSIEGLKITLVDTNNPPYNYGLWIKPVDETSCEAENMTHTDSKYLYSMLSDHTASLVIDGYQILINSGTVYNYKWEMTLTYASPTQGTFRGTYFKANTSFVAAISGYFYIGDKKPDDGNIDGNDNNDNNDGDDNNDNNEDETSYKVEYSDELYVSFSSANIETGRAGFSLRYTDTDKYQSDDVYLSAGICYDENPHPTINDKSTEQKIITKYLKFVNLPDLKSGTTYFLRPYSLDKKAKKIIYYGEKSFETVGKNIKLSLSQSSEKKNTVVISYEINKSELYHVTLTRYLNSGQVVKDFGYKTAGAFANTTFTDPEYWGVNSYFVLTAFDESNRIFYQSNKQYKLF